MRKVPKHGWTCFHCGETFWTEDSARIHFGAEQDSVPGCKVAEKVGLLEALRLCEDEGRKAWRLVQDQSTDAYRAMASMQIRHAESLKSVQDHAFRQGLIAGQKMSPDINVQRYMWLRDQHWSESLYCVVKDPKGSIKLGSVSPSGSLLDSAIDEELAKQHKKA